MTGFTSSSQYRIQPEIHMSDHVSQEDDNHKLTGIRKGGIRRAKETQNGIKENQTDDHKKESDDQVECHRISQKVLSPFVVTLSQTYTDTC